MPALRNGEGLRALDPTLASLALSELLLIGGSLWIMGHLNHNMMPMNRIMQMQR